MDQSLQRTALTDRHEAAGAKMAPFAGWAMPLEFSGTVSEHHAVRSRVGVFDVSHLGTVFLTGPDSTAVISSSFTNDAPALEVGQSQYTLCCAEDGGILDDLIVYRLPVGSGEPAWMVVPNAANTAAVVQRLRHVAADARVEIDDESTTHAILAVQGPAALDVTSVVLGQDLTSIPYLAVRRLEVPGGSSAAVCRTGYTGESGCEIVAVDEAAPALWDALLAAGAVPVGLGARDTLRLEMGYPLHGNDIDATTNPFEARLGWAVKLDHGEFVGRDALVDLKASGADRRLVGLRGSGRRPLRAGLDVLVDDQVVGSLTSGGYAPTLEVGIGLGYIDRRVDVGTAAVIDVRGRPVDAKVVAPPFVDRSPKP